MKKNFDMADYFMRALLDNAVGGVPQYVTSTTKTSNDFPHFDVVSYDEGERTVVSIAVAGFHVDQLSTVVENGVLVVKGDRADPEEDDGARGAQYMHRGIARRSFVKKFTLGEDLKVERAWVDNGILNIEVVREVPESRKPKVIPIH